MSFHSWLQNLRSPLALSRDQRKRARRVSLRAAAHRLKLEPLEDRRLLAFSAPVDYAVGLSPFEMKAGDFNNDGQLDLATANAGESTVSVLLGNANGTFQPAQTSAAGPYLQSLAVGDFNADGNLDLAAANAYDLSVLLGNGNGTFQAPTNIGIGSDPASVAVGDFNADGKLDLGVTSNIYTPGYYYGWYGWYPGYYTGYANVLLGNGAGGFSAPHSTFLDYAFHNSALAADLNGDLYDDFVTFNSYGYVTVLLGDSSGFLQGPSFVYTGDYSYAVAVGDLDGDGANDLVTANFNGNSVGVLLGDGSSGFSGPKNYAVGGYPSSIVLGDFTHDGNLDVATSNYYSGQVSVLHGGADGAFSTPVHSPAGAAPWAIAAGDFNGDGWLDAATANPAGDQHNVSVLINDQSWPVPPPLPPPSASINDVTVTEGNTGTVNATFTVTLSAVSNVDVTVHYDTSNGSAASGSDYAAGSGEVIILAGQISQAFTVTVIGDRLTEPTETYFVNLSAPVNATIGDGEGVGTILDNEPRISISDVTKAEGKNRKTLFTFTVTLSAAYDQPVTMSYHTVDGTATSSGDYIAKTGTLTFAPGETTKTITIEVKGDNKKEANETFYLDLFGLSINALFTKDRGVGTILNDDR